MASPFSSSTAVRERGVIAERHRRGEQRRIARVLHDGHFVLRQRAGLIRTDHLCAAERLHRRQAALDFRRVQQRLFQPAAEHPAAHGGAGLVQHPQKRPFFILGAHGFRQLQIPAGVQIQLHEFAGGVVLQLPDVGQIVFLDEQQRLQQGTGGNLGGGQAGQAQIGKGGMEMVLQQRFGIGQVELVGLSFVHAAVEPEKQRVVDELAGNAVAAADDLRGAEPAQLRCNGLRTVADGDVKRAGGHVAEGQAEFPVQPVQAGHIVVFMLVEHTAFCDGAGGDDPGNVPVHQSLGQRRVLHLLADGHLVALGHQPGNVGIHAVEGHAAHGRLLLLGLAPVPGGQRHVQLLGGQSGVFVEHFVEVAQPEEQDAVLIAFLHFIVLALHGRQLGGRCGHGCISFSQSAIRPVRLQVVEPVMVTGW